MRSYSRTGCIVGSAVLALVICVGRAANAQQDSLRPPAPAASPAADPAAPDSVITPRSASEAEALGLKLVGLYDADDGHWIAGATLRDTLGNEAVTSPIGVAVLNELTPIAGFYLLEIRKPGYVPRRLRFRTDTTSEFMLALAPNPLGDGTTLAPVIVTAERRLTEDDGAKTGFISRCVTGLVSCVGRRELDNHPAGGLDMLLSHVNGIDRVCVALPHVAGQKHGIQKSTQCVVEMLNLSGEDPRCTPTYYVDGFEWHVAGARNAQGDIDQFLNHANIAGIEVYLPGRPAPARFTSPLDDCGSIVIWTR